MAHRGARYCRFPSASGSGTSSTLALPPHVARNLFLRSGDFVLSHAGHVGLFEACEQVRECLFLRLCVIGTLLRSVCMSQSKGTMASARQSGI